MTDKEALQQNPSSKAPENILTEQRVLQVSHIDFLGARRSGQIVVHRDVAEDICSFFTRAEELAFPIASIVPVSHPNIAWDDFTSIEYNNTSGFNYRTIAGTDKLSWHAYGCAFDVNPIQNPYIKLDSKGKELWRIPSDATYETSSPGTLHANHPLVHLMKEYGWEWGGDWTDCRIDYQHFEKHLR